MASGLPGFQGAFFHGSINRMADAEALPASSDVDVGVAFAPARLPPRLGKTERDGVLVEGAPVSMDRIATAEQLLADYRLGPSFRVDSIIADPTGHLRRVQQEVERDFAERRWVLARCEDARSNCRAFVGGLDASAPFHHQATCWLFAAGAPTHVVLTAGLRNPTVRRRYSAARELLELADRLDVHEKLLAMLGSATMSPARVEHHLERMAHAFDLAGAVVRPEFRFAADLSEAARPVAVGGSLELIQRGEHREAMFWIAVTHARCMNVVEDGGSLELVQEIEPGFRSLMSDLGAGSFEPMRRRADELEAFLPDLMALAGQLVSAGPDSA